MNAGSTERRTRAAALPLAAWLSLITAGLATACEERLPDAPPPPSRHELVSAPPGAVGAHPASAAEPLKLPTFLPEHRSAPSPDPEDDDEPEEEPDAGADAGGSSPSPNGVAL